MKERGLSLAFARSYSECFREPAWHAERPKLCSNELCSELMILGYGQFNVCDPTGIKDLITRSVRWC
jgi:hypothetical protein